MMLCGAAGRDINRIPDGDIPMQSILGTIRLGQTKRVVDPVTGKKRLEETNFVRSLKFKDKTDDDLLSLQPIWA